jgi:hypothetical protein
MNKIFEAYTNTENPGAFSGLSGFKKNNAFKKNVKKSLLKTPVYTLHKPKRKIFKRSKVWVSEIDEQWQIDLIDLKSFKGSNFGKTFILTAIDVFSKYAWAIPIKDKEAKSCKIALEHILKTSGRIPSYIYLDNGKEFLGVFKKFCDERKIRIFPTKSPLKASIIERFNRTLKEKMWRVFTHNSLKKIKFPKNYTSFIQNLVNSYNNSYHRTIKMKPSQVSNENREKIYKNLYNDQIEKINFKFSIGEYVRISEEKKIFSKGYTANWSEDIYIIKNRIPTSPPRYLIKDLEGNNYPNKFYSEELQKVLYEEFPYDTLLVLKENSDKLLVEKLNSDKKTIWIDKND